MKKILVSFLFPITLLILFFKKIIEISFEIGQPIVDGFMELTEKNYNFWKGIFKWK